MPDRKSGVFARSLHTYGGKEPLTSTWPLPLIWFSSNYSHMTLPLEILANNQPDALFHVFIYLISLHVSSFTMLIIRRSNCINTYSGMTSLCEWLLGMPVRRELQFPPDLLFQALPCSSSGDRIILTHHLAWLVFVSDCLLRWSGGNCSSLLTSIPSSHLHRLIIPDNVLIQFDSLMMSTVMLETHREMK